MKVIIAIFAACVFATVADARCWKPGQNVSEYFDRHTSTGVYSQTESRCASREYAFGTRLTITNKSNGRSTTCTVDDFGPAEWTKCKVDVNIVAKKQLRMGDRGIIRAKIEVERIQVASLGVDEIGMEAAYYGMEASPPVRFDRLDSPTVPQVAKTSPEAPLRLLQAARVYMGKTASQIGLHRHTLWCAAFIAKLAPDLARKLDNPDWARDWADLPRTKARIGAIVVLARGQNAGHIGIVSGFDKRGNPRVVSGNHGNRVAEGVYPKRRVIAYVGA